MLLLRDTYAQAGSAQRASVASASESPHRTGIGLARSLRTGAGSGWPAATAAAVLALLTALRLALAASLPLAPDEAYYWVWSRAMAPGYFDHPPMIALWIRAGTWLAGDTAFGVRLLGPISAAFGSVILWDAAERLLPDRQAGLLAAALLNATVLVGVGSILATPDAPLLLFWILGLWGMARIVTGGSGVWWLAVGLFVGLALVSKYTAASLPLGIGIWLAVAGRGWLRRGEPYAGAALALAAVAPVVWWNATHQWVSFLRQGGRAGAWSPDRAPRYLLELIGGQMAAATPLIFLLCGAGAVIAARAAWQKRDPVWCLLAVLSAVPALIFVEHAIGDRVQANWPAIVYPAAAVSAAGLTGQWWRRLRPPAIGLGLVMTGAVYIQAIWAPLSLPPKHDPIALHMAGWHDLAAAVEEARQRIGAGFVAADNYGVAAELVRELPASVPVVAVGPRWSSFRLPVAPFGGMIGLLVEPEDHASPIWPEAREIGKAARTRQGTVIQVYRLYRALPDPSTSAVLLPHPISE